MQIFGFKILTFVTFYLNYAIFIPRHTLYIHKIEKS